MKGNVIRAILIFSSTDMLNRANEEVSQEGKHAQCVITNMEGKSSEDIKICSICY